MEKSEKTTRQDDKIDKKLSKSLIKEKVSVSLSSKNSVNKSNYDYHTYCNKSSLIKSARTKEQASYFYNKKHKSINTLFIPFPSTTKNADNNKLFDKKYNDNANKNTNSNINQNSKNSINNVFFFSNK